MRDLSNTDALMWLVENDPQLRSTILGIMVFDSTPDWERVQHRVRWVAGELPMLRHRIVSSSVNRARLEWEPVPDLDLNYHLRRLTLREATYRDVLEYARTSAMAGFDRARPLWEFTFVEGLQGGRAAFVTKMHHVLTDGIGAVQLATHSFDFEPEPAARKDAVLHPETVVEPLDPVVRVAGDVIHEVGAAADVVSHQLWHAVPNLVRAARRPDRAVTGSIEVARSVGRLVAPTLTTMSPVMRRRSLARDFHVLEVPLTELRGAAKAAGGRVNDAFLAGVTGGLRRYHELHLAPVETLRMAMPISLRTADDPEAGNRVTIMRFPIEVGIVDPIARMHSAAATVQRQREEASIPYTDTVAGFLNRLPNALIGSMMKHVDFLASNVPGSPVPMYFEGARAERWHPFGPTAGAAVNVTLMSYCGVCCVGVNRDTHAIPDGEDFMGCLRDGFEEVLAVGRRAELHAVS